MRIRMLCASLGALVLLCSPLHAADTDKSTQTSPTKTRRAKPHRPPAHSGPGETRKERDQRLLRECRGKPNAGVCEGYAR